MGRSGRLGLVERLTRDLKRLRSLSWAERWLLVETLPVTVAMAIGLRLRGYRRLTALLERTAPLDGPPPREAAETVAERAMRIAAVVDVALRRGPFSGTCLERSLSLWWLLRRRGVESDLRLGVRRDGEFEAHAWVEVDGVVLNDRSEPGGRYARIDTAVR